MVHMVQTPPGFKIQQVPGKVVRGTTKAGVGVGAIALGMLAFLLLRGFGPGGSGGAGDAGEGSDGAQDRTSVAASDDATSAPADSDRSSAQPRGLSGDDDDLTSDERSALASQVLSVLIDERQFLIQIAATPTPLFRPSPLARIAELAARAPGDTNGIRVRILRRETARPSAENELREVLKSVGLLDDAILMPAETVP
jgi:hypothetical protein